MATESPFIGKEGPSGHGGPSFSIPAWETGAAAPSVSLLFFRTCVHTCIYM